jgi:hypothetical protein
MSDDLKTVSNSTVGPFDDEPGRLLQPARFFRHPRDVVRDARLTTAEKRAILSSWASDASAIESMPALRQIPGSDFVVRFDDVIDALEELDQEADGRDCSGIEFGPRSSFAPLDAEDTPPKSMSPVAPCGVGKVQGTPALGRPIGAGSSRQCRRETHAQHSEWRKEKDHEHAQSHSLGPKK